MYSMEMEACKGYAHGEIRELLVNYDVVEYQSDLVSKVNDVCLEMGYDCRNDKPRFERLATTLQNNIYSISSDEKVRDKLFAYANRVMNIGRNYLVLKTGY